MALWHNLKLVSKVTNLQEWHCYHTSKKKKKSILWLSDDVIPAKFPCYSFVTWSQNEWAATLPKLAKFPCLLIDRCGKGRAPWLQFDCECKPLSWRKSRPAGDLQVQPGEVCLGLLWIMLFALVFITFTSSAVKGEEKHARFLALTTHILWCLHGIHYFSCQIYPAVGSQLHVVVARSSRSVMRSVSLLFLWCELLFLCTGC